MSLARLVTRATFTPGPSSSSNRVTVGPTVCPSSRVSTPCAASALTRARPAALISARSSSWAFERDNSLDGGNRHSPVAAPASMESDAGDTLARGHRGPRLGGRVRRWRGLRDDVGLGPLVRGGDDGRFGAEHVVEVEEHAPFSGHASPATASHHDVVGGLHGVVLDLIDPAPSSP